MINQFKSLYALVILLTLACQASYAQGEKVAFSLQEAIDYALINNQSGKNARLEMDIADKQVGEILADGLPQVNANADFGYNYEIQQTLVEGSIFDPTVPEGVLVPVAFGVPYTSNFGVTLDQMVFDGAYFIGLKAAKTFTELSKKDNIKNNIDIAEAVSKAYFGVLVNRERYLLIERNFTRVDSLLIDTKHLFEGGFAEKIDVSRVQVQYNNLKVELDNFQAIVDLSESLLKFQMGMDPKADIDLTDAIESIDYFDFELTNDFNYDRRIEYSQLNIREDLNQLDIRNIKSQYVPTLDLYARYGRNTGALEFGDVFTNDWYGAGVVGLTARWAVFDGLRKRRQVQQRRLKGEQIKNQFELLKYNIDIEIEQSLTNYNREIERMRAQRENMELAREVYDVAKLKYDEGVGSNIEVIDADASYKEAQTNFYNALYDALISKIDLQKAYGVLL